MKWKYPRIKICGITNEQDLLVCQSAGIDAVGFVLYPRSPRYISPEKIRELLPLIYPWVSPVAVLTTMDTALMNRLVNWGIGTFQVYFDIEEDELLKLRKKKIKVIRAIGLNELENVRLRNYDAVLLDARDKDKLGGTGKVIDWDRAREVVERWDKPVILAGGLSPDNVEEAIKKVRPFAIDVATGLEKKPGKKDEKKVFSFVRAVYRACLDLGD